MNASGPLLRTADVQAYGSVRLTAVKSLSLLGGGHGVPGPAPRQAPSACAMRITQAISAPTGPVDQRRPLLGYAIRIASLIVRSPVHHRSRQRGTSSQRDLASSSSSRVGFGSGL